MLPSEAMTHGRRAFTLIELLVVIAILALLAGLLVPAVSRALEQGRIAPCLQNLRSLGMTMSLYAADHDDRMPTACIQQADMVPNFLNYMGDKSRDRAYTAWTCPADRTLKERAILNAATKNPSDQHYYSFSFVEAYVPACATDPTCTPYYTLTNYFPLSEHVIAAPSEAVFLSDGGWWRVVNNSLSFRHQRVQFRHGRPSAMETMETEQRSGLWGQVLGYDTKGAFQTARANVYYYDGHAATLSYASYASGLNAFIASHSDRPGLTAIPTSEFQ